MENEQVIGTYECPQGESCSINLIKMYSLKDL